MPRYGSESLAGLALALALAASAWSQDLAQRTPARTLALVDSLFAAFQGDSALVLLQPLERLAETSADEALLLDVLCAKGMILAIQNRPLLAEPPLRRALQLAESRADSTRLSRALRFLAYSEGAKGEADASRRHYERLLSIALARNDSTHQAHGRLGLAYVTLLSGDSLTASHGYREALRLFQSLGSRRYELIARTGLARCLAGIGDIGAQRAALQEVVRLAREWSDPHQEAHGVNNLGAAEYLIGDPGVALRHFRAAEQLFASNGDSLGTVLPAINAAMALGNLGRNGAAKAELLRALRTCRNHGYRDEAAAALEELGDVQLRTDRPDSAALLFRECLRLHAPSTKVRAEALAGLARSLAARDSVAAALQLLRAETAKEGMDRAWLEQAHGALLLAAGRTEEAEPVLAQAVRTARRDGNVEAEIACLTMLGRSQRRLGAIEAARSSLQSACELWETGRGRSLDPEWREQLGKDARTLYAELASFLLDFPAPDAAADRSRSVFDQLQRFKARTLQERLRVPSGRPAPGSLRAPITLREAQSTLLRPGELLLDVFLDGERAIVLAVDRQECRVLRFESGDDLTGRARRWMQLIAASQTGAPSAVTSTLVNTAAQALGAELLDPLAMMLQRNRRLLFAPDGEWNALPIDALAWQGESGVPMPLAHSHEIVRVPSATLLAELRASPEQAIQPQAGPMLVISGATVPELVELPAMQREVSDLAQRFESTQRIGNAETSQLEMPLLAGANLLHFASHIEIDSSRPWRSAIRVAVADSIGGSTRLEASQVAALRLKAQLVFLSGCESASGQVLSGEGVLGLSAAFLASGVPTVVATLWPVHDRAASRFVAAFYEELANGATAARSLQRAQARLRSAASTSDPFHWAAFVLIGEGDTTVALSRRSAPRLWLWSTLALVAGSVVLWALRRRFVFVTRRRERDLI